MSEPRKLLSVTTLINNGTSKAALQYWAANETSDYALEHLDGIAALAKTDRKGAYDLLKDSRFASNTRSKKRGTDVHTAVEQIDLGVEPDIRGEAAPYVEQYRKFVAEHRPTPKLAEATVYNPELGYAGTLDKIMEFERWPGDDFVVDVKTTDRAKGHKDRYGYKKSRPPYPDVALQLVAYRRAPFVGIEPPVKVEKHNDRHYFFDPETTHLEPMPETRGAFVLVVSPYDYELVPVVTDEEVWQAFLHVKGVAEFALVGSKRVLSKAVPPLPTEELKAA